MTKNRLAFAMAVLVLVCIARANDASGGRSGLVERAFAAWNSHDPDKVVVFYASDVVYEDIPFGIVAHGQAEMRKMAVDFFTAVPDLKFEVTRSSIDKNHGSIEWVFTGTDSGLFKTGKRFSVRGASIFELRHGHFSANQDFYDAATIMKQVGVLPK